MAGRRVIGNKGDEQSTEQPLPPLPGKDAGPDQWREYHRRLFDAGKLNPREPSK